ncbi:diguanylate cyclase [Pseudomonas folii]|jgi:diguanylate cyclase (GGDEF)-like protein|uniref:diguanylate cyclase n=1 Tax=Pseudomonas folii TaxID=2762593 RepID=A0ABR7AUZ7_9PSED|nr:diguanylate cyclase [Pseudomonas folii]MBC3948751.1 GGDEF domain-containing protein [Pseudomonas folii]
MNTLSASDRAQLLRETTAQFWQHIVPIVQIAFCIHLVLFVLFSALKVPLLAVGNGFSILAYVACLRAIRAGRYSLAGTLMSGEIILHALLATWILGWNSNFYFYLYCVIPIVAFSFHSARRLRLLLNLAILVVSVGGFALRGHMGINSGVAPQILDVLGIINVLTAVGVLLHGTALSVRFTRSMQLNLFHTANRDSLTNLYNRRRVMLGVRQLARSVPSAIILLDIDHFKQINDRLGHEQGDLILQRVAEAINSNVRGTDVASRWGGEEFLVLMPDASEQAAQVVADRILLRIREWVGQVDQGPLTVTATLAVSEIRSGESFESALNRADQALYQGKQQGRNKVMLAG